MTPTVGRPAVALGSVVLVITIVRWPWAGLICAVALCLLPAVAHRRRERILAHVIGRELPEVIELLRIGAEGGLNLRLSIEAVSEIAPGHVSAALGRAARAASAGALLGDAIEDCTQPLGGAARPLVSALAASARYGVALGPSLERLAADARAEERRCGEAEARKVPVKLLFPLVLCVLPGFALLTVAPLIAGGVEPLRLP